MATVKLTIDTRSEKKDGTFPIKLYINHKGDFYISTGISVDVEQWIGDDRKPTGVRYIDAPLVQMLTQAKAIIYQLRADGKLPLMSARELKSEIMAAFGQEPRSESPRQSKLIASGFIPFVKGRNKERTKEIYAETLRKLNKRYDTLSLKFTDITASWLRSFEDSLYDEGLKTNTVAIHMRNIRAVFNRAIDDEVVGQNTYPFRKFKITTEKTRKRSLSVEQLRTLKDYDCQKHQVMYRDMFMLIFYLVGINIIDLSNLVDITNGRIEYKRSKTGRLYSIAIEPEAMEIINRYKGKKHLLSILDNYAKHTDFMRRLNKNLRSIGPWEYVENAAKDKRFAKKNKKKITPLFPDITTYWARHTWATIAASLDIPKETIAAALGHEIGSNVTSIYIDFDQRKIDQANRQVIDWVVGR